MYTSHDDIKAKSISYSSKARSTSDIKYIVIHYTANKTDKAVSNAKYYRDKNTREAGAHYFIDATDCYKSINLHNIAWAVGGAKYSNCSTTGGGTMYGKVKNANSVSIEMCSTGGKISDATFENAVILTKKLMKKYNIPAKNVYRHFDVTGKACPSSKYTGSWDKTDEWIGKDAKLWRRFKEELTK